MYIWKAYNLIDKKLIDWEYEKRDKNTLLKLLQKLNKWKVTIYYSDNLKTYKEVIPNDKLKQTKTQIYTIENNNARQDIGLQTLEEEHTLYPNIFKC